MIYSVFPGSGKTTVAKKYPQIVYDAESSNFQWLDSKQNTSEQTKGVLKEKNPEWPQNYINFIKQHTENHIVLIAAQPAILNKLDDLHIQYMTVAPTTDQKQIYIDRYKSRGNNEKFIKLMFDNFDQFIFDMKSHKNAKHVSLKKDQYLSSLFQANIWYNMYIQL